MTKKKTEETTLEPVVVEELPKLVDASDFMAAVDEVFPAEDRAAHHLRSAKELLSEVGHFETNLACSKIDEALALLQACEASDVP